MITTKCFGSWTSNGPRVGGYIGENRLYVYENSGGPVQTRTADLYRVKVVPVNHLLTSALKTQELHDLDLVLKWTSVRVWTSHGPHTLARGMAPCLLLRARSFSPFSMLSQYDNNQFFLSGWVSKGHPVAKDPADVKIP